LLQESPAAPVGTIPTVAEQEDLAQLAAASDSLPERSRVLYELLRKLCGQSRMLTCLRGIQHLAREDHPAGARLLAAVLDANTPGSQLLPRVHRFSSTRRIFLRAPTGELENAFLRVWIRRFIKLNDCCCALNTQGAPQTCATNCRPGDEQPFPLLRESLKKLLMSQRGAKTGPDNEHAVLLASLLGLEVDAYEERISHLAGSIDPFRMQAVARVLPLLSRADTEIRDLRRFVGWLKEGDFESAFLKRVPRSLAVMEPSEHQAFVKALNGTPDLAPLARLHAESLRNPLPVTLLAGWCCRLMALAHRLVLVGARRGELDLLTAVAIAQQYGRNDVLRLPLGPSLGHTLSEILSAPSDDETSTGSSSALAGWPLDGCTVRGDELLIQVPSARSNGRRWPDDLPVRQGLPAAEAEPETDDDEQPDASAETIKNLVLGAATSESVLLGFLRNPQIVGIPGLVEAVVARVRSPRILEIIAQDRSLHAGFANRGVPLALLRSPVNVSIKAIRKFVHAKYVSKVELRRLLKDKAGIRREVIREIGDYLRTLA